jgi:hypothetical protein
MICGIAIKHRDAKNGVQINYCCSCFSFSACMAANFALNAAIPEGISPAGAAAGGGGNFAASPGKSANGVAAAASPESENAGVFAEAADSLSVGSTDESVNIPFSKPSISLWDSTLMVKSPSLTVIVV